MMKINMKKNLIIITSTALSLFASAAFAAPKTIEVEGQARFVSDAPVEKIVGTAPVKGSLSIDFDKPEAVKGSFKVPVSQMKTGNETRDEHLQGAEWLNAAKCPNIAFEASSAEVKESKPADKRGISTVKLAVKGNMTINCVSQPVTAKVVLKRKAKMAKIGGKFEVKLADFKVAGKKGVVGKKVGETIQVAINLSNKGK
jgi:polyisoprenoid-binding protein YceI